MIVFLLEACPPLTPRGSLPPFPRACKCLSIQTHHGCHSALLHRVFDDSMRGGKRQERESPLFDRSLNNWWRGLLLFGGVLSMTSCFLSSDSRPVSHRQLWRTLNELTQVAPLLLGGLPVSLASRLASRLASGLASVLACMTAQVSCRRGARLMMSLRAFTRIHDQLALCQDSELLRMSSLLDPAPCTLKDLKQRSFSNSHFRSMIQFVSDI